MRNVATIALGVTVLLFGPFAFDLDAQAPQGQEVELTAQVVDLACYSVHDLRGEDHRMCAQVCADQGVSLVLLDEEGRLYHPVGRDMPSSGDEENEQLRPHAERDVTVRGTVLERGGIRSIIIEDVSGA